MRSLLALVLVVLAAAVVSAAPARADVLASSEGAVSATVSFDKSADDLQWKNVRVLVTRGGVPVVDRAMAVRGCAQPYCRPVDVVVRDLDADAEPEVLLAVHTGGAHCCTVSELLTWDGTGYRSRFHDWLDFGFEIDDLDGDGRPELRSADARFRYEFASFAASAFPVQVFQVDGGAYEDVTAGFPALVRADAKRWLRIYRGRRGKRTIEYEGTLAAWVADMELLGKRRTADRELRIALRHRWIDRAYVRALDRFLVATGYRR